MHINSQILLFVPTFLPIHTSLYRPEVCPVSLHLPPSVSGLPPAPRHTQQLALLATRTFLLPFGYLLGTLLPQGLCTCLSLCLKQSFSGVCMASSFSFTSLLDSDLFAEAQPNTLFNPVTFPLLSFPFGSVSAI